MTQEFKQRVTLPCSAKEAFEILLDSRKHTKVIGSATFVNKREGAKVSKLDGLFLGRNIEITPNKKIVQVWRSKNWSQGTYSVVNLTAIETSKTRCILELTQVGIPTKYFKSTQNQWNNEWAQLKEYILTNAGKTKKTTSNRAPAKLVVKTYGKAIAKTTKGRGAAGLGTATKKKQTAKRAAATRKAKTKRRAA